MELRLSANRSFRYHEIGFVSIERGTDSDWKGGIQRNMTKGKVHYDRNFQRQKALFENVGQALAILFARFGFRILAIRIDADGHTRDLLKQACIEQLRQHAIEAVRNLIQVLEEKNSVFEGRLVRSANRCAEERKVATDKRARGDAAAERDGMGEF